MSCSPFSLGAGVLSTNRFCKDRPLTPKAIDSCNSWQTPKASVHPIGTALKTGLSLCFGP
eukprot:6492120-Amphidinium_carterae.1